jgi:hypothetical protein
MNLPISFHRCDGTIVHESQPLTKSPCEKRGNCLRYWGWEHEKGPVRILVYLHTGESCGMFVERVTES